LFGGVRPNLVTGSARINGRKVSVTYDVPLINPPAGPPPRPAKGVATHADDFSWVNWFGVVFEFSGPQCPAVAYLWKATAEGQPADQERILDAADAGHQRLRSLFHGHPAWGTMIVQDVNEPGCYKLSRPV
jgi:hypothetical protein